MTIAEVTEFLALVSDAFPERMRTNAGALAIWSRMLSDLSIAEAQRALVEYLSDGPPHPPSISDIRRRVSDATTGAVNAAEAWEEVRKAICRVGRYKTPTFRSPLVAAAVEAIGWEALCNTLEDDLPTVRAQFERYLKARGETAAKAGNSGRLEEHLTRIGGATAGALLRIGGRK